MGVTPHCKSPATCSVCMGVKPRRVDFVDGEVTIDGVPVRTVEPTQDPMRNYQRKGGKR